MEDGGQQPASCTMPPRPRFLFSRSPPPVEPPVRGFGVGIFQAFSNGRWWRAFPLGSRASEAGQAGHGVCLTPRPCPAPHPSWNTKPLQGLSALGHPVSPSSWACTFLSKQLEGSRFHILLLPRPTPRPAGWVLPSAECCPGPVTPMPPGPLSKVLGSSHPISWQESGRAGQSPRAVDLKSSVLSHSTTAS